LKANPKGLVSENLQGTSTFKITIVGKHSDPGAFPAGLETTLARALANVELWHPVIKWLTALLQRDGRVTGNQFVKQAELSNTSDTSF
jgi:hypothetical protein